MSTKRKKTTPKQLERALASLELLGDLQHQELLQQLDAGQALHLPDLSKRCGQSPYKTKRQLDRLKEAGLVFSPKRYPSAYAANKVKIVKIAMRLKKCVG